MRNRIYMIDKKREQRRASPAWEVGT